MPLFDRKTFTIPDGALVEQGHIEVSGDVVISNKATVKGDITTPARVFIGERAHIEGNIKAGEEVRIDRWTRIEGNITCDGSVYIGDRVSIKGKLDVSGNLDLGSDVEIEDYEARGWINIRNPIPIIIYIIVYLLDLIRKGRGDEVDKILEELEEMDEDIVISPDFMFVSDASYVNLKDIYVKGVLKLGDEVKIRVNIRSEGDIITGQKNDIAGNLISRGSIRIAPSTKVLGDIRADGSVNISTECDIVGNIHGHNVVIESSSRVEGIIIAPAGVRIITPETRLMEEKLQRFNAGAESLDAILE